MLRNAEVVRCRCQHKRTTFLSGPPPKLQMLLTNRKNDVGCVLESEPLLKYRPQRFKKRGKYHLLVTPQVFHSVLVTRVNNCIYNFTRAALLKRGTFIIIEVDDITGGSRAT